MPGSERESLLPARPDDRDHRAGDEPRHAFGLDIEVAFPTPGLSRARGTAPGRRTRVQLRSPAEIDRGWPGDGVHRVLEEHLEPADGPPARTIDFHPDHGYRLYARNFGLARISPVGAEVLCAPPDRDPWSWQRFLVGRVLPWAAVLRGYEVLHASAVAIDGRAVAFVGPTGTGKTSIALRLALLGANFVTDDVLAIDVVDDVPRVWPGASLASLRPTEHEALPPDTWRRLGPTLGTSGKTYLAIEPSTEPLPLGRLYVLAPGPGPPIDSLGTIEPAMLLGNTFVVGVQSPERLRNQLDVCATVARCTDAFRLRVVSGVDAGTLARTVLEHVREAGSSP